MATTVVSARVNQATKTQASLIAQSAGTNLGEVIKQVLEEMVRTRSVPISSEAQQTCDRQKERFHAFMAWRSELPDCPELANMTDEQLREMLVARYV